MKGAILAAVLDMGTGTLQQSLKSLTILLDTPVLRAAGVPAHSILMDVEAYDTWERFGTNLDRKGNPLTGGESRPVPRLRDGERALYERLTSPERTRHRRVEQERVPLAVALDHVRRLVDTK